MMSQKTAKMLRQGFTNRDQVIAALDAFLSPKTPAIAEDKSDESWDNLARAIGIQVAPVPLTLAEQAELIRKEAEAREALKTMREEQDKTRNATAVAVTATA